MSGPRGAPVKRIMTHVGKFKVYFARDHVAPLVWRLQSLDGERWVVAAKDIVFSDVVVRTVYQAKETPDDEDGEPSAWFEVTGEMTIDDDGIACVRAPLAVSDQQSTSWPTHCLICRRNAAVIGETRCMVCKFFKP